MRSSLSYPVGNVTDMTASLATQLPANIDEIVAAVQASLSDDVLKPERRREKARREAAGEVFHPHAWHCYRASEALSHLLGGKAAGYKTMNMRHEGDSHWWILHEPSGTHLDPTAAQFATPVPYEQGKGKGFLTAEPCKEAAVIMQRAEQLLTVA